jgi:hypothetical protein
MVTDAPAPEYPPPSTWAELSCYRRAGTGEPTDLLDWVLKQIAQLDRDLLICPPAGGTRVRGTLTKPWRIDKNGLRFNFIRTDDADQRVFVHETDLVDAFSCDVGDEVSFELYEQGGGQYRAHRVGGPEHVDPPPSVSLRQLDEEATKRCVENIHKRLYFPVIQVWRDGRSIDDDDCPEEFAQVMRTRIEFLGGLLEEEELPEAVWEEIAFLLACMHADAPPAFVQKVPGLKRSTWRRARLLGFALGAVSQPWQEKALSKLLAHRSEGSLRVLAYAIWREPNFVDKIPLAALAGISDHLAERLEAIEPCPSQAADRSGWPRRTWARNTVELLELLLGLLRSRSASDPDVRMLLQPHQRIAKQLATQVERITELVAEADVTLPSRVLINIPKPEAERRTPDLLYALRLYLTGDSGANAIHIADVSEA